MTVYKKITEYVKENRIEELGKFLCKIYLSNFPSTDYDACEFCPMTNKCKPSHNGYISLLSENAEEYIPTKEEIMWGGFD